MWVYRKMKSPNGSDRYVVGYFAPSGKWEPVTEFDQEARAARRTCYLNGGTGSDMKD